jgi:hypothetical protein
MAFPACSLAEVASAPARDRDWEDFRARLAEPGPELAALGVLLPLAGDSVALS